jgi:hypothetical protein
MLSPNQATTLEEEANLALDKLTSMISTLNLERVRQIKSRLVAITGRVQKVDYWLRIGMPINNLFFFLHICFKLWLCP